MNFSFFPPAANKIILPTAVLAVICVIGVFYGLPYYMPDNPSNDTIVQWRLPILIVYLICDILMFLYLGIIGAEIIVDYSGIVYKKYFKSYIIPWSAIDRIQSLHTSQSISLAIYISENYDDYLLKNKKQFILRHDDEMINEIKKYYDVVE